MTMPSDNIYVNYQPPPLVPRVKRRAKVGLTPAVSCHDLSADVTLDHHTVHPAKIGLKTPKEVDAEFDDDLETYCNHYDKKIPAAMVTKSKLQSTGMIHAHSTPNLTNGTDELTDQTTSCPKKKKKGLQRFINFLKKGKKGKKQIDKLIHHPVMEDLGVPEFLDGAKDMAIDAIRSQIGI